MKEMIMRLY